MNGVLLFMNSINEKGEERMNAYAVKPDMPFVTRKALKRTPASKDNINMIKYMDSHEFSFHIDKGTGKFVSGVAKRK